MPPAFAELAGSLPKIKLKKGEGRKGETREGGGNGGVSIICAQQPKDVVGHLPGGAP